MIREIKIEDADQLANLVQQVENTSKFMLMDAGERNISTEEMEKRIKGIQSSHNTTIFVAEEDGNLIGYLMAIGGTARKNKHTAYLVIGLLESHRGIGIGTILLQTLEKWATIHEIVRLELTVVTENESAVALYRKIGFEIEGIKKKSLKIDGVFYNEYYMSKLL